MEMTEEQQNEARQRNLLRFVHAQDSGGIYDGTGTYAQALEEVRAGHKRGHWIWYVFPQMKGLGSSEISQFYGINGREEAKAYIEHPILREGLWKSVRQCSTARLPSTTFLAAIQSKSGPVFCCLRPFRTSPFSSESRASIGGKSLFYAYINNLR